MNPLDRHVVVDLETTGLYPDYPTTPWKPSTSICSLTLTSFGKTTAPLTTRG